MRHNSSMNVGILQELNWVDWVVLLILAGYALAGVQRGFLIGILDLAGVAISLGAAVLGYRQVADLILRVAQVPSAIVFIGAFLGIVILVEVLFSALVRLLFRLSSPLLFALGPFSFLDRVLGVLPGLVKGLIFSALLLLPFALFPLVPQISAGIERSTLGSRLVAYTVNAAPDVDAFLGQPLSEGLGFLAPPQTEQGIKLHFGALGTLSPDPAAEQEMFDLVNQERTKAGLKPLQWDPQLQAVARQHSMEMFQMQYFAHDSPVSGTPFDRMKKAGIQFTFAGENIALAPNVQIAHEGLMNSPEHRANILRPQFGKIGIGVIKSEFHGSMFTQDFTN